MPSKTCTQHPRPRCGLVVGVCLEGGMSMRFKVDVVVVARGDYFRATAVVPHQGYTATGEITLPRSIIGLEPEECESRAAHIAISYALAELAAKIGSSR